MPWPDNRRTRRCPKERSPGLAVLGFAIAASSLPWRYHATAGSSPRFRPTKPPAANYGLLPTVSKAPMAANAGDKLTVVILAMSSPLGRGNPEGYGLRHLR